MKIKKTWLTVYFTEGNATVELNINYETKAYDIKQSCEEGVRFRSNYANTPAEPFIFNFNKAECVMAALKFVKQELELLPNRITEP